MSDHMKTLNALVKATADLERNTAKCVAQCRNFWAMYSSISVEAQNDMVDERNQTLITMDLLCDALNDAADELEKQ